MENKVAALYPAGSVNEAVTEPVAGRYRICNAIGRGRLGEIYAATDERHRDLGVERHLALQLLPDAIAFDDARFAELKAGYAGLLVKAHPSVVAYYDIGRDSRFGYIAMALLEGASLRKVLDQESPLPLSDVSAVLCAVGNALDFLHARSITHGNVSPETVFVTDDLEFRLLDVVPLPARESRDGPSADGAVADDLYDLACLVYEMLAGRHPYNYHDRARAARSGLVPDRIDSLPERQWRALERALSLRGEDRPRTIAAFLKEFGIRGNERLRPGEETEARSRPQTPPSPASGQAFSRPSAQQAPLRAERDPRRTKRPRETGSLLLFLVLIALGAWFGAGDPQADVGKLLDTIGPLRDGPDRTVPASPPQAATPVTSTPDVAGGDADAARQSASAVSAPAAAPAGDGSPASAEPTKSGPPAESMNTDATAAPDTPAFGSAFVTVSEGNVAARVQAELPGDDFTAAGYSWWTRPHGARPEQDYVAVGPQPLRADDDGRTATMLVPLVNDGRPEPPEDFFVHVGVRDTSGRLVPVDTIRVDIVDDD